MLETDEEVDLEILFQEDENLECSIEDCSMDAVFAVSHRECGHTVFACEMHGVALEFECAFNLVTEYECLNCGAAGLLGDLLTVERL